ncbi:galactose mutarotase, partial [Thioclava sp. BHET1]
MSADIRPFGTQSNGIEVSAIRLRSGELSATILTRGAILQELRLAGSAHSLTLGSDMLAAYEGPMAYFGAVVGPVANRIGGARAMIGGHLTGFLPNEGTTLLHSGAVGLHGRVWDIAEASAESVTLRLDLPDGVDGFPGNRELTARYSLADQTLSLELQATSDAPSLMNLAHHGFWNLDGRADISGQELSVNAAHY